MNLGSFTSAVVKALLKFITDEVSIMPLSTAKGSWLNCYCRSTKLLTTYVACARNKSDSTVGALKSRFNYEISDI